MMDKFFFTPPGAPKSPDLREGISWDAAFALILADSLNYFDLLIARARAREVQLEMCEREFLANLAEDWVGRRKGGARTISDNRRRLKIAAYYLEYLKLDQGEPPRGRKAEAEKATCEKCGLSDTRQVRQAVTFAKTVRYDLLSWSWWPMARRLARKGKIEQLHRAY